MVVLKQIRLTRATSEPVEPVRLIDLQGIDTARRISLAARDDTDEMMMASKRHDRQLISDINAKLANQSFLSPPAKVKRAYAAAYSSSPRKPPISPATRSGGSSVATASTLAHRRYQLQNLDNSDDVYSMPPTPVTRSVIRAASLPPTAPATSIPLPPAAAVVPDGFDRPFCPSTYASMKLGGSQLNGPTTALYSDLDSSSVAQNGVDNYGGYVRTRVTGPPAKLTPVTDLAIRQAHRDLDRIERELKYQPAEGSNRYQYTPKSTFTVTSDETPAVRRPLPAWILVNSSTPSTTGGVGAGAGSLGSLRFRAASLSPARSAPTSATVVTTGYRGAGHFSPATPVTRRRTSPVRPSELIALMTIATPIKTTSDSKVTSHTTSKRLYDVPTLTSYRASTEPSVYQVTSSSTTGTTPVFRHSEFSSTAPTSTGGRPKMSEARRKVRDVLCKVKKDPHYFD